MKHKWIAPEAFPDSACGTMRNAARAYKPKFLNELHLRGVAWGQLKGFDDAINRYARQMCYRKDDFRDEARPRGER